MKKRLAIIALGFIVATGISLSVTSYLDWPSYDRSEIENYRAFSPAQAGQPKHVFLGSCDIALPIVANDPNRPNEMARMDHAAWLGSMMNFIVDSRYGTAGASKAGFYDIAAPSTVMPHHLLYLYSALRVPNLRTIIYVGGLSTAHTGISPREALELVAVLEYYGRVYPGSRAYADTYKEYIQQGEAFAEGERRYGSGWRNDIDPETMTHRGRTAAAVAGISDTAARNELLRRIKAGLASVFGGAAETSRQILDGFSGFGRRMRDWQTRNILDWAAGIYGAESRTPEFSMLAEETPFLSGEDAPINRAYMRLMAEIARARGIKLVVYAQPMLYLSPERYDRIFRPNYVELLHTWLADYDVPIIDHTLRHDLNQYDFQYEMQPCSRPDCVGRDRVSNGFWANAIGRYKQARLLLDSLEKTGVVQLGAKSSRPEWGGEAALPDIDLCVRPVGSDAERTCLPWRVDRPAAGAGG